MTRVEVSPDLAPATAAMRRPIPWREVVTAALTGTLLAMALVLVHVQITGRSPLNLIQAGERGPSADAIREDFPDSAMSSGIGHDGQQFYAVARQPMHWKDAAQDLDRGPYRLQRPLFPWLAWALHPSGGGPGLVLAMFVVGLAGLFAGAVATGMLSVSLSGPARLATVFPFLPGALVTLRISAADTLAVALALLAVTCLRRERNGWAIAAAVAAVLAKESSFLLLAGYALWRRDRASVVAAGSSAAAAGLLAVALRLTFPEAGRQVVEFALPFTSLFRALGVWAGGGEKLAFVTITVTVALAVLALRRRGLRGNPFGWAIVLQLVLLSVLSYDASGLDLNATRSALPLGICAILSLATKPKPAAAAKPPTLRPASS